MSSAAPPRQEPLSTCTVTPLTEGRLVPVAAGSVPRDGSLVEVAVLAVVVVVLVVEVVAGAAAVRRPPGVPAPRKWSTAQNSARKTTSTAAARAVGPGRNLTSLSVVSRWPSPGRPWAASRRPAPPRTPPDPPRGQTAPSRTPRGTGGALPAARGALTLQALDQHGIRRERHRVVDQPAEELIVRGGADAELPPDGLFLRPRILPPLPLEGEDGPVTLCQRSCRRLGHGWAPP